MSVPVLEMKEISKSFYGTQVLKNVSLTVGKGEIHCLVGENGAGKSTLMNILFGMPVIINTGGFEGASSSTASRWPLTRPGRPLMQASAWCTRSSCCCRGFL